MKIRSLHLPEVHFSSRELLLPSHLRPLLPLLHTLLLKHPQLQIKITSNPPRALLLTPPLIRLTQITPQRKSVLHAGEELKVIRLLRLTENVDRLITSRGLERKIGLRAGEEERAREVLEVVFLQESWVGEGADVAGWRGAGA